LWPAPASTSTNSRKPRFFSPNDAGPEQICHFERIARGLARLCPGAAPIYGPDPAAEASLTHVPSAQSALRLRAVLA